METQNSIKTNLLRVIQQIHVHACMRVVIRFTLEEYRSNAVPNVDLCRPNVIPNVD